MPRPKAELCQEDRKKILKAKVMRCRGTGIAAIAAHLGVKPRWLRYRLGEDEGTGEQPGWAIAKEELARRLALIPVDTRDLTARLMGDPIPNDPRRGMTS